MRSLMMAAFAGCAVALAAGGAPAEDRKKADAKPVTDAEFVTMAASGGMYEVESSKMAKEQATGEEAKKFADHMIKDHTKANEELKAAAGKAGVEVPAKLLPKQQKMLDDLKATKGDDFDKKYADQQLKAHVETVALFENAAKNVTNADLKAFAEGTLPTLKHHLEHAKKLNKAGTEK